VYEGVPRSFGIVHVAADGLEKVEKIVILQYLFCLILKILLYCVHGAICSLPRYRMSLIIFNSYYYYYFLFPILMY
jgi:hypothetical protein